MNLKRSAGFTCLLVWAPWGLCFVPHPLGACARRLSAVRPRQVFRRGLGSPSTNLSSGCCLRLPGLWPLSAVLVPGLWLLVLSLQQRGILRFGVTSLGGGRCPQAPPGCLFSQHLFPRSCRALGSPLQGPGLFPVPVGGLSWLGHSLSLLSILAHASVSPCRPVTWVLFGCVKISVSAVRITFSCTPLLFHVRGGGRRRLLAGSS